MTESPEEAAQTLVTVAVAAYIDITRYLMRDALAKYEGLTDAEKDAIQAERGSGYLAEARWLESRGKRLLRMMGQDATRVQLPLNEEGRVQLKAAAAKADTALTKLLSVLASAARDQILG